MQIAHILTRTPVIPVLVIRRLDEAVPLARALVAGGLTVLEVTLRTPYALAAIAAIRYAVPTALVGAGTVRRPNDLEAAAGAGAQFAVSPGLTPELSKAAARCPVPLLPGVMTPSEAMTAFDAGFTHLKLFPAEPAGGVDLLRALAGPMPELRFCPTGGITLELAPAYLALPNVVCVGGSWMVPSAQIEAGEWGDITQLATDAAALGATPGRVAHRAAS